MSAAPHARSRWTGFLIGIAVGLFTKELGLRNVVSYWGPMTAPILAIGAVFAALWTTRLHKLLAAVPVVLGVLWLTVAYTPLCRALLGPLVRADAIADGDAIFVLSSNIQPDDEPSPSALARATRAVELLGQHRAPRLYLSELGPPAGSYVRYLATSVQKMCGAEAAIESVGLVGNTHDEAQRVAELFRAHGWKRLLLVSSPTHMRRAAATFERAGVPEVIAVPAVETLFDAERLRTSDERITAFGPVIHEWIGWYSYKLRGWL